MQQNVPENSFYAWQRELALRDAEGFASPQPKSRAANQAQQNDNGASPQRPTFLPLTLASPSGLPLLEVALAQGAVLRVQRAVMWPRSRWCWPLWRVHDAEPVAKRADFLCTIAADMRRSFDGLARLAEEHLAQRSSPTTIWKAAAKFSALIDLGLVVDATKPRSIKPINFALTCLHTGPYGIYSNSNLLESYTALFRRYQQMLIADFSSDSSTSFRRRER